LQLNRSWSGVHGLVTGQGKIEGVIHSHAWLEKDWNGMKWVYDPSYQLLCPAFLFYQSGKIETAFSYSFPEYMRKICETGKYGPWEKEFEDFC